MEEFEPSSDTWNREWKSSKIGNGNGGDRAKFRLLELGMEEFEPISRLGIGNGGVRAQFRCWELGMEEFEQSSRLGNGNDRVRVKFRCLDSGMEVRSLEAGM